MQSKFLYIFSHGRVAKIKKSDGSIVWEIKAKEHGISTVGGYADFRHDGEFLYIGVSGQLFCLKESDGSLVWKNELKGWGYNFISIANDMSNQAEKAGAHAAAVAAATAASA